MKVLVRHRWTCKTFVGQREHAGVPNLRETSDPRASERVRTTAVFGGFSLLEVRSPAETGTHTAARDYPVHFVAPHALHPMRHGSCAEKPETRSRRFGVEEYSGPHPANRGRAAEQVRRVPRAVLRLAAPEGGRIGRKELRRWRTVPSGSTVVQTGARTRITGDLGPERIARLHRQNSYHLRRFPGNDGKSTSNVRPVNTALGFCTNKG